MVTLDKIFTITYGVNLELYRLIQDDSEESINFVSRTKSNNGVSARVLRVEGIEPNPANTLSIALTGSVLEVFYQEEEYYSGRDIAYLTPIDPMDKWTMLTYCTIIRANQFRYCQGRGANTTVGTLLVPDRDEISKFPIYKVLPDVSDIPDYFLQEGYEKACWYMDYIDRDAFEKKYAGRATEASLKLNTEKWKEFHLYDFFKIDSGNKFDRSKMTMGAPTVNFIGRSSEKNGVTAFVDEIEGVEPYQPGYLTVALGGEYIGSCFIQDYPFYTSQNVNVLIPLVEMDNYVKLFIAHLIRFESASNYKAFARELNSHIKTDFVIKLPTKNNRIPDFDFMSDYIKTLSFSINIGD